MAVDTRKIIRSGLSASSYLPNNLGNTIGAISGFRQGVTDPAANALSEPVSPNTRIAYSGADVYAFITPYSANLPIGTTFIPLKNLIAISYSVHRDKMPVRRLGTEMAIEYTLGTKTIAGSLVLLNFDRSALSELIIGKDIYGDTQLIDTYDDIPPFDITLMFQEEIQGRFGDKSTFGSTKQKAAGTLPVDGSAGQGTVQHQAQGNNPITYSVLEIKGIRLVDEGLVIGTDEAYLETTFQYVAEEIKPLQPIILTANQIQGFGQILDGDNLTNVNGKWFQGDQPFVYADDAQSLAAPPTIKPLELASSATPVAFGFVRSGGDPELPHDYELVIEGIGNEIYIPGLVDPANGLYGYSNGGIGLISYGLLEPHNGESDCITSYTIDHANGTTTTHTVNTKETEAACTITGIVNAPTQITNIPGATSHAAGSTGTWTPFLPDHVPWVGLNSKQWPPTLQDTNVLGRVIFPISKGEMEWLHDAGLDALVHEEIINPGPRLSSVDKREDTDSFTEQSLSVQELCNTTFAGYCEAAFNATGKIFGACVGDKLGEDSWL